MENRGEFVEHGMDTPEKRAAFRVSVFGTASDKDEEAMRVAADIAGFLVEDGGFKIATGGQDSGAMKAVAERASEVAKKMTRPDLEPVGVAMEKWQKSGSPNIKMVDSLAQCLQGLINDSDAFVSVTGGIGTFLETLNVLHGINIEKGTDVYKKPIIICDPSIKMHDAIRGIEKAFGLFESNKELYGLVFSVNDPKQVEAITEIFYKRKNGLEVTKEDEETLKRYSFEWYLDDKYEGGGGI